MVQANAEAAPGTGAHGEKDAARAFLSTRRPYGLRQKDHGEMVWSHSGHARGHAGHGGRIHDLALMRNDFPRSS